MNQSWKRDETCLCAYDNQINQSSSRVSPYRGLYDGIPTKYNCYAAATAAAESQMMIFDGKKEGM